MSGNGNGINVEVLIDALAAADGERADVLSAFYGDVVNMLPHVKDPQERLVLAGIALGVSIALQLEHYKAWSMQEAERHKAVMREVEERLERIEAVCPGLEGEQ